MDLFKNTAAASLLVAAAILLSSFTFLDTSLRVDVVDELGTKIEGAAVTLYATEDDYRSGENPIANTVYTDDKGRVVIKDLEPQAYFIDVSKGDMDNVGMATKTPELEENKRNKILIVIG